MWIAAWTALAAHAQPNVVLITLDTTRADALSCYGVPPGPYRTATVTTPRIDALAAEGARFERFFAHAPSTLSSHASMLTGLDPHGHGIVRNGFPLAPGIPTLTERLRGAGWDTVAVVASSALERAMGLDRGFRVYDDGVTSGVAGTVDGSSHYQVPAPDVVRRALAEVDARPDRAAPLFLWAHFYDPHAPYQPPAPYDTRFRDPGAVAVETVGKPFQAFALSVRQQKADPAAIAYVASQYLGEVAHVDEQVGVLLDGLRSRGLLREAIVVVVGDHGETLADEPEYAWSHGSNTALEVMRVPLVVRGYGVPLAERAVVQRQAGVSGLGPTLEVLAGLPPTLGAAAPFDALLRPGPVDDTDGWPDRPTIPVFVEATRPRQAEAQDGWNNRWMHRGVYAGGYAVVGAPFLKLPPVPIAWGRWPEAGVQDVLAGMVQAWDAAAPGHVGKVAAPSTEAALKALGYAE